MAMACARDGPYFAMARKTDSSSSSIASRSRSMRRPTYVLVNVARSESRPAQSSASTFRWIAAASACSASGSTSALGSKV